MLGRFFDEETLKLMEKIKPTEWDVYKTEAIDFSKPFIWCDDELLEGEREALEQHNAFDSWIEIDLASDPSQLESLVKTMDILSCFR